MIGGMIAAPVAAWFVRVVPSHLLGVLVGGIIILTNVRTLLHSFEIASSITLFIYIFLFFSWLISIIYALRNLKKGQHKKRFLSKN
ncbi:hypothetical protein GCM10020331_052940 [Ectobacillus funiculus]